MNNIVSESSDTSLDTLRSRIDRIDEAIHDLIIERATIAGQIRDAKDEAEGQGYMRPAREAQMLRTRAKHHKGSLPFVVVARIWREMMSALTSMQGAFSVAVFAPEVRRGYWDTARDHFGSYAQIKAHDSAVSVLRDLSGHEATVGLLPEPGDDDGDCWWEFLLNSDANHKGPRIVGRLPFFGRTNARSEDRPALMLANIRPQGTQDDRSFLVVELMDDFSRSAFKGSLERAGLKPSRFLARRNYENANHALHLVEVEGFVESGDMDKSRFDPEFSSKLSRICCIGSYAVPLTDVPSGDTK